MKRRIVVASRLTDGRVVYLTTQGDWSTRIDHGHVAETEAEAAALLDLATAAAERNFVVDPYLIEAAGESQGARPVRLRERIRAYGPTILMGDRAPAGGAH